MEQSEFTPPARLSLTDQEISARLGAATADEAGMIAAMDFLEEQTNLRNQDNETTEQWIATMESSTDPRATIALENLERAKKGLDPLPLVSPVPEYPTFNPSTLNLEEAVEPDQDLEPEVFEQVFDHATQALETSSAEENAVEVQEQHSQLPAPKVRGVKLVSAANWVLGVGVLAPVLGAALSAMLGLNFVTSMLAGIVGILVGVKVNILALVTARRTKRGLAVSSRATFGVFGAIVPGLLLLFAGLGVIFAAAFASGKLFNNTFVGLGNFDDQIFNLGEINVSLGTSLAVALVVFVSALAIFGGSFARWLKISISGFVLAGFVTFAALTIPGIDYANLAGQFSTEGFLKVAPLFALVASVFAYGVDGESIAASAWGASRRNLTWPILIFGFLVPLLSYGHIAAILNGRTYDTEIAVIQQLMTVGSPLSASIFVDVALIAVVGFIFIGVSKLIEALKTLGTNHIGYGLASIVATSVSLGVVAVALGTTQPLLFSLDFTALLLVPSAFWAGALATETLMRRGNYHDASLTRSYGFYGSFNLLACTGLVFATVLGFAISQPLPYLPWLGFLSDTFGFRVDIVIASLLVLGFAVVFTLATGYPRILRQQRETKAVEDRRYDLVDVVVE